MSTVNPQRRPQANLITDPDGFNVADVSKNALHTSIVDSSGNPIVISGGGAAGTLPVSVMSDGSIVSAGNSTTTLLGSGGTFIGQWVDAINYAQVTVVCRSDQTSALDGLQIQYSSDGVNVDHIVSDTALANESASLQSGIHGRYVRVTYVNGTVAQSSFFRLQTLFNCISGLGTIKDLDTSMRGDDNCLETRSMLAGRTSINASNFTDVVTDVYGSLQTSLAGSSVDAFGRARVSNPVALFSNNFQFNAQPLLFDIVVTGAGSAVKTTNVSSLTLSTGGTTNGDGVVVQSHRYFRYEAGKAQEIVFTGSLGAKKANVRSRYGYFDANDGCFFEMDGTDGASVNIRTNTSGSPVNSAHILQANWNIDPLDGSGVSGITIDFTKDQIFLIDLQWLGVGRVRFGFIINGILCYCHQIFNANLMTVPYMNTARLPVRGEIFNTGTAASTTTMTMVCQSVVTEGGEENPNALQFSANNGATLIAVTTRRAVLSIRPQVTFNSIPNHVSLRPAGISITADATTFFEIVYNGTLGGVPSWNAVNATNSGADFDVAGTTVTGGVVIASGYVGTTNKQTADINLPLNDLLNPTISATGVQDILSVVCTAVGGTTPNIGAAITWQERRN